MLHLLHRLLRRVVVFNTARIPVVAQPRARYHLLHSHALLHQRVRLELIEKLGEIALVSVDPEHVRAQVGHQTARPLPEDGPVLLDEERLERVADLVAHVGEGQVKTGHDVALQLVDGTDRLGRFQGVPD